MFALPLFSEETPPLDLRAQVRCTERLVIAWNGIPFLSCCISEWNAGREAGRPERWETATGFRVMARFWLLLENPM